jgi:hypothetical protein
MRGEAQDKGKYSLIASYVIHSSKGLNSCLNYTVCMYADAVLFIRWRKWPLRMALQIISVRIEALERQGEVM